MGDFDLDAVARVFAQYIGIDAAAEPQLLGIAKSALQDLPFGWSVAVADGDNKGIPYYIDSKNDKSSWTHPLQSKYVRLVETERKRLEIEAEMSRLRDMKWRMWVEGKELLDGSIEVFQKLSTARANDEDKLRELTIALSAVDIMVGNDHRSPHSIHFHQRKGKKNRKMVRGAWLKWMMANRTFSDVVLTEDQYEQFSETVRNMVMEEGGQKILNSLQYVKPGKGKGLDSLRPDEKLLNAMFADECRRVWEEACDELNERVYEYIAREKLSVDFGSEPRSDSALAYNCLFALSMPRLRAWQEDDEDEDVTEARRERNVKDASGRNEFESWVKYKDSMKMALPDPSEVIPMKPVPRMSFANDNLTDIRAKDKGAPRTTADLMINSGLRTVHANYGKGKPDPFVDLKESRRRLMEMGFVDKDNFDDTEDADNPFDKTRYAESKSLNVTTMDKKERERLKELSKGKAYDAWATLKEAREQALIYLSAIEKPSDPGPTAASGQNVGKVNTHRAGGAPTSRPPVLPPSFGRASNGNGLRDSVSANAIKPYSGSGTSGAGASDGKNSKMGLSDVMEVGQALKKVDRTLFNEWSRWADGVLSPTVAAVLWDFFYPRTCDLHGMVGTEAKNSFLRILYANPNFVEFMDHPYVFTYREFVPEKWRRRERLMESKAHMSSEEKRNFLFQSPLTRDEFSKLLLDMGVLMTGMELKSLVDAFDPEDTGSIDMNDFLKYTWPKRETNAGALDVLSKKCCWSSTCRKTGMVNGFVVTIRDREGSERAHVSHKDDDSDGAASEEEEQHRPHSGPKLKHQLQEKVVSTLSNGDQKIVREVADRRRREAILRKFGLLPGNGEVERSVPDSRIRGLSTMAAIRRKIAAAEAKRAQSDKAGEKDRTLDIHNSAIPREDLSSTIPGSATINIAYAPEAPAGGVDGSATYSGGFQNFLDDCEMYEGNQKGVIALPDFKIVLADAGISLTPHELKHLVKHFGASTSKDTPAVNHLAIGEALEAYEYFEVGDAVEVDYKGRGAWCPAVITQDIDGANFDVKYLRLTMGGKVIPAPKKKYEEDPDDDDDDKYVDEEYEAEEEDEEKKRRNRKHLKRLAKGRKDEPCQYALWLESHSGRREGLRFLAEVSKDARVVAALQNKLSNAAVPAAPLCWAVNPDEEDASFEDGEELNPTSEILLRWRPGSGGGDASFFSIEFAGQAGCVGAEMRYKEIYRDPPNASGVKCCYQFRMQSLEPATSYLFRIRAVSGSGASEYTYLTVTTRLVLAIYPRVVKLSMNSVTLRWLFTPQSQRRLAQLRKLFYEALHKSERYLADKNVEDIKKEELAAVLDGAVESFPELKPFLSKAKTKYGIPDNAWGEARFLSVLDNMEKDTGDEISWDELEKFFIATGFVETDAAGGKAAPFRQQAWKGSGSTCKCGQMSQGVRASLGATAPSKGSLSQAMRSLRAGATSMSATNIYAVGGGAHCCVTCTPCEDCCSGNTARTTYVIEQLGSDGEYHDILRTTGGQGTINRLVPGETYKFRIYGLNQDGSAGPRSEVIVLHMPFETPAPPCIALQGCCSDTPRALIGPRSITLRWKERQAIKFANTRDKTFVKKMLMEWSGQVSEGPSVTTAELEKAFQEFDTNSDGFIDAAELGKLLSHLGIAPTEQKFKSAFSEICDQDRDGTITFEEFSQWWHHSGVEYVLKRSSAVRDPRNAHAMLHCVAAGALRGSSTVGRSASLNVLVCGTTRRGGTLVWKGTPWRDWEKDRDPSWHVTIGGKEATPYEYRREHPVDIDGDPRDPSAEGADGLDGEEAAAISERDISVKAEITTDIVCYRGKALQFEEKGLTPNQMYYFKLRHVGVRSSSFLSPSLMVMTAPLPCRKPAFVRMQGSSARLKWYPPDFGAHTFEVQLQLAGSASKSGSDELPVGSEWVNVYNGQETVWTATSATLTPETSYNIRVVGINAQGTYGEASPPLSFTTPGRETNREPLSKKNADSFSIECMGDICVGDIILVTERLFKYDNGNVDISENSNLTAPASSGASGLYKGPQRRSSSRTDRSKEDKVRLDLGVTSGVRKISLNESSNGSQPVKESNTGGIGANHFQPVPGMGQFAGERTFAAHVVWDNYRSVKEDRPEGAAPLNKVSFAKDRRCWLEVIWSRGSNGAARKNELQPGAVVSRTQTHLEQFEVYRHPWLHENQRRPLEEELNLLANCYGKFTNYHHYQCDAGF